MERQETDLDHVDRFLDSIRDELPASLDFEVEGIVDRISAIHRRLQRMVDETLEHHGLDHRDWKIMNALRWAGAPYRRSAGELARIADLSTGAMTSRLDGLEEAGVVRRLRDPEDRRGVLVELTKAGRKLHEEAIAVQAEKEQLIAAALNAREKKQLNGLLRRVLLELQDRFPK